MDALHYAKFEPHRQFVLFHAEDRGIQTPRSPLLRVRREKYLILQDDEEIILP
jgi:hypothetical protein